MGRQQNRNKKQKEPHPSLSLVRRGIKMERWIENKNLEAVVPPVAVQPLEDFNYDL